MKRDANMRNVATMRRLCREILAQCDHYERNQEHGDDTGRFLVIHNIAWRLLQVSLYARARYVRLHR